MGAKSVPHLLNNNQKPNQLSVCNDLEDQDKKGRNYLYKAVTGDENWVYGYDPETMDITEIEAKSQAVLDSKKNVSSRDASSSGRCAGPGIETLKRTTLDETISLCYIVAV
jgi:hypothetical protein